MPSSLSLLRQAYLLSYTDHVPLEAINKELSRHESNSQQAIIMELSCEESCWSAGNNQAAQQSLNISSPMACQRPDCCQISAGWSTGMVISCPPIRFISSRMMALILSMTRWPRG